MNANNHQSGGLLAVAQACLHGPSCWVLGSNPETHGRFSLGQVPMGTRVWSSCPRNFVQKLLQGSTNLVWRPLALAMLQAVNRMGMDCMLFLMDYKRLDLRGLSGGSSGING